MSRTVAVNRRARHDYEIDRTLEAGLVLQGTEVKALRNGGASIRDAYAEPREGELWLVNAHIPPYPNAARAAQHEPKRPRKLLVKRREVAKLAVAVQQEGMTAVPLSLYFNDSGIAKVEIALGRGRKTRDRRQEIKKREWEREKARVMRNRG